LTPLGSPNSGGAASDSKIHWRREHGLSIITSDASRSGRSRWMRFHHEGPRTMLRFLVSNKVGRQTYEHPSGPVEFGRGPERDGLTRIVIQDGYVSKDHVKVEELADGQVKIDNLSARNS